MSNVSRRDFLKGSFAVGATFAIGTSARPVLGANETLNVACAGIHGRGQSHMGAAVSESQRATRVLLLPRSIAHPSMSIGKLSPRSRGRDYSASIR